MPLQVLSHYPAHPVPLGVRVFDSGDSPCPYLPGRSMRSRALLARQMDAEIYHDFMDAGFRRSGEVFYQCVCSGCRECTQIRVPTDSFVPSKSQRRVWRRNADLSVTASVPSLTDEKYQLYLAYLTHRHERDGSTMGDLERFLYKSPVQTIEFEYRNSSGRLLGVSIADMCSRSLSSVYMFFDPAEAKRSLGVYSAIFEIAWARDKGIPYYYLGFWVKDAGSMAYKAAYQPYEILRTDGLWAR